MKYAMFLYIDPATGGMLFTIIFGLISAGIYFLRTVFLKIKYSLYLGNNKKTTEKLPIVIFSDHKRYWNVFEPICNELESRKQKAYYYTMSEDDPALRKKYNYIECDYIGSGNKAFSKMNMLMACVVVSTTPSLDVFQWRRSKDVDYYIHVPHTASDLTMYKMFGLDYYDAVLLSGEYQIKQLKKLELIRKMPQKDMCLTGIPYMDDMLNRVHDYSNGLKTEKDDCVTVLLAPSWGTNGILYKYGERLIDALVDTGYNIIIRPHPQSYNSEKEMLDALIKKYNDKISWNNDNDNFEVLCKADVLISDFSGVLFDFSLVFDKTVIYTSPQYDKSQYDCVWLDDELWTFEILPKLGVELKEQDFSNIKSVIDDCMANPTFSEGRKQAREETWYDIGNGAKNMTNYIVKKYNSLAKVNEEKQDE
jgi:hypothetical protein